MADNPYESPANVEGVKRNGCFLNGLAIVFALLFLWSAISSVVVLTSGKTEPWFQDLVGFAVVLIVVFILPHAILALLSAACWYRSRHLLYAALWIIGVEVVLNLAIFSGVARLLRS